MHRFGKEHEPLGRNDGESVVLVVIGVLLPHMRHGGHGPSHSGTDLSGGATLGHLPRSRGWGVAACLGRRARRTGFARRARTALGQGLAQEQVAGENGQDQGDHEKTTGRSTEHHDVFPHASRGKRLTSATRRGSYPMIRHDTPRGQFGFPDETGDFSHVTGPYGPGDATSGDGRHFFDIRP